MAVNARWFETEIGGRRADVFEPHSAPVGAILFLHGHGQVTLANNESYTAQFASSRLACVCPSGMRSWWGERICTEFDPGVSPSDYLREAVVPWMAETWKGAARPIALLGVSMGGQGVLRLAYRHPEEFPIVAALAPAVDFYNWYGRGLPLDGMYATREAARQDSATLWLHPLAWPRHQFIACDPLDVEWFDGVERLQSKLASTGIPFESDLKTSHGGHSWEYFDHLAPRVIAFLVERLGVERSRLDVVGPFGGQSGT